MAEPAPFGWCGGEAWPAAWLAGWTVVVVWIAGLTGLLDLAGWPEGVRVVAREERPHPGAQLRFTDVGRSRRPALQDQEKSG